MKTDHQVWRRETLLVHDLGDPGRKAGPTTPPICQSTAFAYATAEELADVFAGREAGYVYSRIANPTVAQFERRLAMLEGGIGAVACASGMAAISATVMALAGAGDEIVSGNSIFGGTRSLFQRTLARQGINVRFVEATDVDAYRRAITDRTRLIFVEAMGNPKLDVPDLAALAAVARDAGAALAVDNTICTPMILRPKEFGADLIIHSAAKFIAGHGQAIGGIIVDGGSGPWDSGRYPHLAEWRRRAGPMAFLAYLRTQICRDLGGCLAPFSAFLLSLGLESLGVRMQRHGDNAVAVARFLAGHPRVRGLRYPGLADHPQHEIARRQFAGDYGALLTFRLEDQARCFQFINRLRLARNLANLGDAKTLVIHPASTFCREFTVAEREAAGVTDDLVRLSVGIEHVDDIIGDLAHALADHDRTAPNHSTNRSEQS